MRSDESGMDGTVYDLEGNRLGRTDDIEATFVEAALGYAKNGPVYVVTNGSRPEFDGRLIAAGVPVIVDEAVGDDRALIFEGRPEEWGGELG